MPTKKTKPDVGPESPSEQTDEERRRIEERVVSDLSPEQEAELDRKIAEGVGDGPEITPGMDGFTLDFSHEGYIYRYAFHDLSTEQIMCAEAIFDLFHQALRKPPRTMRELEASDQMEYMARAFGYLLRKVLPDGSLQKWDRRGGRAEAETFFRSLPGRSWKDLKRCKDDFFSHADIIDQKLLAQLAPMIDPAVSAAYPQTPTPNGSEDSEQR
jgi:hypothetical protein